MRLHTYYFFLVAACMAVTAVSSAPVLKPVLLRSPGFIPPKSTQSLNLPKLSESVAGSGPDKDDSEWSMDGLMFEFNEVKTQAKSLLWKTINADKRAGDVFSLVIDVGLLGYKWDKFMSSRQWRELNENQQIGSQKIFQDKVAEFENDCRSLDTLLSGSQPFFLSKEQLDKLSREIRLFQTESEILLRNDQNNAKIKFRDSATGLLKKWWMESTAKAFTQGAAEETMRHDIGWLERWLANYRTGEERHAATEKYFQISVRNMRDKLEELKGIGVADDF